MPQNLDAIDFIRSLMMAVVQKMDLTSAPDAPEAISKRFRFEKREDHMKLGSCLYSYADAAMAIRGYLSSASQERGTDFVYLRLYGVLNAAYLQLGVIECLVEITKLSKKKRFIEQLKTHELIRCRNMLAAHTVTFKENGSTHSITVIQGTFGGTGVSFRVNETNENTSHDIELLLQKWATEMRESLISVSEKLITNVYKSNVDKQREWHEKLAALK